VEACFPIEGKPLQKRIWQDLQLYLEDNTQAWELQADGSYRRIRSATGEEARSAQQRLMAEQTPS
jgi:polyphosphate kinase